jgi:hypothetical protein
MPWGIPVAEIFYWIEVNLRPPLKPLVLLPLLLLKVSLLLVSCLIAYSKHLYVCVYIA